MVFVDDQTLVMVSSAHGALCSSSTQPPQRSTTTSPPVTTATEAPTSRPSAKFCSNASRTTPKRSSQRPAIGAASEVAVRPAPAGASVEAVSLDIVVIPWSACGSR